MDIKKELDEINVDINGIKDPNLKAVIIKLLNIIEVQTRIISEQKKEIQKLRDENNKLKGEQGKPDIREQTKKNVSSETERKKKKKKNKKGKKKNKIKIDRIEYCRIDKSELPPDAKFKGYASCLFQEIIIKTDNVEFKKEVYYSKSLNKTFTASLPEGYSGEFGPFLKSLVITLYNLKMTEPAIADFLKTNNIIISQSTISRILTEKHEWFHQEKKDIVAAGLSSSIHQQMDDTGARVNGENYYTHVLCNQFYTAYFTKPNKDRLTILKILTQGDVAFQFNEKSFTLMKQMRLSNKTINKLKAKDCKEFMDELDRFFVKGIIPR